MNAKLEEIAKEERNAYLRNYRAKNKDKVKEYNRNYWLRKAKQKLEREGFKEAGE